ncbi:hypothetical protein SNE25_21375 [Mucilaginibacter sabulilitoris]|uniref:Uncharacterized protein n=1 Tax=Mucilaginibacter sabulilitoris TaxID=1173583 RepID=A0ABZ0TFB9_9SPHI|nr:hypothetical protein [Mucilaginibacter sabulilitoris]WPU91871.1 hypothetical protein SNE25_21375 [Mucilaginibacter sabulilitoris]
MLTTPFKPYYLETTIDPNDKIKGAANEVLRDSRKNWWWRALVGGLAGGLIAGLLVK